MFELATRLILAGTATLLAGLLAPDAFSLVWKVSSIVGIYSLLLHLLELRGWRNVGISGLAAALDAAATAVVLGSAGQLERFGFLVLAPTAFATVRHGIHAAAVAPLAAGALLGPGTMAGGLDPSPVLLAQAACVLAVGLLLNQRRVSESLAFHPEPLAHTEDEAEPDALLELRESYRQLKDQYRSLEIRARRDRLVRQLAEAEPSRGQSSMVALADRLRSVAECRSVTLYSLSQDGTRMVVHAVSGDPGGSLTEESVAVDVRDSAAAMKDRLQRALRAAYSPAEAPPMANVLLTDSGRVVGMLHATADNEQALERATVALEDAAPYLARRLADDRRRAAVERRLRETELLYELSSTFLGATTPNTAAARVVRELFAVLEADHLSVQWVEDGECLIAAQAGARLRFLDAMSFAAGPGVGGWLGIGAPEIAIFDTGEDSRCEPTEFLKRRVRSLCIVPLVDGERVVGLVAAASHRTGGIQEAQVRTLRAVAAELARTVGRLTRGRDLPEGLMTPGEFRRVAEGCPEGALVHLETLRKESLVESFGRPAIEHALRKLAVRIRSRLPAGGAVCRRDEMDFVVLLPRHSETDAAKWANEAAAHASMIGLRTPDGSARIPLAVRARVASLNSLEASETESAAA
ncbi:MAG: GAF domain-containing protein [Fimbriimonadales bacterium]|nr:GAF domain-containing protein [Fimbriimonadales bacterium]